MDTVTASLTESERPPAWPVLGAIRAWAQPIVALTTGLTVGFEALARFDEYRGPVAEAFERAWATGMGPDLEAEALRAALRMEGRPPGTYLAVNVSPRALNMDLVRDIFDRDLAGIVVELTESHYVPTSELRLTADWLRARGARLAIDDLGTGYAGLERLVSVRPDLIKIDRSLVTQLETDEVSRIMVESLVRFASRVGAGVIAEGIEEQSTLEVVAELDIAYGQGFLFSPARPTWTFPGRQAVEAARAVHQQALSATPRQDILLNEMVQLDRVAERFGEAEEVVDVQHAVVELTRMLGAVDVGIDLVNETEGCLVALNHQSWAHVGPVRPLDENPLLQWTIESRRAAQVLRGEPLSDQQQQDRLAELGYGALLLVPVVTRGDAIGLLTLFRDEARPWTLAEIRLARIGAGQLAAALERLSA